MKTLELFDRTPAGGKKTCVVEKSRGVGIPSDTHRALQKHLTTAVIDRSIMSGLGPVADWLLLVSPPEIQTSTGL